MKIYCFSHPPDNFKTSNETYKNILNELKNCFQPYSKRLLRYYIYKQDHNVPLNFEDLNLYTPDFLNEENIQSNKTFDLYNLPIFDNKTGDFIWKENNNYEYSGFFDNYMDSTIIDHEIKIEGVGNKTDLDNLLIQLKKFD